VLLKSFKAAEFPAKFYLPATLDKKVKRRRKSSSMPDEENNQLEKKLRSIIETVDVANAVSS
jgi:hypothetical protein